MDVDESNEEEEDDWKGVGVEFSAGGMNSRGELCGMRKWIWRRSECSGAILPVFVPV